MGLIYNRPQRAESEYIMFKTTDTATAKTNLSNVARYFVSHMHDDNEFLFAAQYVVEILKNNTEGLTKRTFQRCWNNMLELVHRNIWNRGEKMTDSLIQILAAENKDKFTIGQIADVVNDGYYLTTTGVGATKNGLTDFSLVFEYDFKQIVLKFA